MNVIKAGFDTAWIQLHMPLRHEGPSVRGGISSVFCCTVTNMKPGEPFPDNVAMTGTAEVRGTRALGENLRNRGERGQDTMTCSQVP